MNGFTPNTKSEKVVKELRHAIQTGGMESGSMLKSVRALASEFSVSTMIVQRALDMLEAENLIWREQGRGVFVKDFRKGRTVEVAMLGMLPDDKNSYAQRIAGILHHPNCREGYNFTLRSITRKEFSSTGFLFQEYRKIVNFLNPDCLLIHSVHLFLAEMLFLSDFRLSFVHSFRLELLSLSAFVFQLEHLSLAEPPAESPSLLVSVRAPGQNNYRPDLAPCRLVQQPSR